MWREAGSSFCLCWHESVLLTEAEARLYLALIGLLPSENVRKRRRGRLDFTVMDV
jgi:hypothetical protein